MVVGGVLLPDLEDFEQRAFFGIGFGNSRVPIDVLPVYFLSHFLPDFTLLVVDEFLKFNGLDKEQVKEAKAKLAHVLEKLSRLYGREPKTVLCSDFMSTPEYQRIFGEVKARIEGNTELAILALETVPENKIHAPTAREYPIHEFACVKYMAEQGHTLKIGPGTEVVYDRVMCLLGLKMGFAYILDALPLGTKEPEPVVHYVGNHTGENNGQRLYFGEDKRVVRAKLQQGSDQALRYFARIASVSGHLLGRETLEPEEIDALYNKRLRRETTRLVMDNIIKPYSEVD